MWNEALDEQTLDPTATSRDPNRPLKHHAKPDELFQALADPSRVRIVNLLAAGELCVCDIVELLGLPQPTVSRHLAILRSSGLARARRLGRYMHYRLSEPRSSLHEALLHALCRCLDGVSFAAERASALERALLRRGEPCELWP